jgi:hypothetical protein
MVYSRSALIVDGRCAHGGGGGSMVSRWLTVDEGACLHLSLLVARCHVVQCFYLIRLHSTTSTHVQAVLICSNCGGQGAPQLLMQGAWGHSCC